MFGKNQFKKNQLLNNLLDMLVKLIIKVCCVHAITKMESIPIVTY